LARIYTRTGDKGETGLVGGVRISKDSLRVQAYGNVDELNSVLGVARAFMKDAEINSLLEELQRDLFAAGADLASPTESKRDVPRITKDMIDALEKTIDRFQEQLLPLKAFILPGGTQAGALLHLARSVARRAERSIVALNKTEKVNEQMIPYMNRLSDLLFVIARVVNHRAGTSEVEWHP
jgi:cob(I)alamin adenosyltransferase